MFLTQDDFNTVITQENLTKIIDNNPTLLDEMILIAVDEMGTYLNGRYDTSAVFEATGSNRNHVLVNKCADIAIFHLFSRIAPKNVPDLRGSRYEMALDWLKMIAKGNITLSLPVKEISNQNGYILYGGNPTFRFQ